jgi:glycosyltransferase involved in cell wall biosynthesis
VIASDITVTREVCGDAASYFPPHDAEALATLMRKHWDEPGGSLTRQAAAAERLNRFTWEASARSLIEAAIAP